MFICVYCFVFLYQLLLVLLLFALVTTPTNISSSFADGVDAVVDTINIKAVTTKAIHCIPLRYFYVKFTLVLYVTSFGFSESLVISSLQVFFGLSCQCKNNFDKT